MILKEIITSVDKDSLYSYTMLITNSSATFTKHPQKSVAPVQFHGIRNEVEGGEPSALLSRISIYSQH